MKPGKRIVTALLAALSIAASASAAPRSDAEQLDVLAATAATDDGWFVTPSKDQEWTHWFYTVTDLDHDGRLEIFKAKKREWDSAPAIQCEELNDEGFGRHYGIFFAGGTDVPDILSTESAGQPLVLHDPAENKYHYIFDDGCVLNEFAFKKTRYAVTLSGDLQVEELAFVLQQESGLDGSLSFNSYLPAWHGVEAESNTPLPDPEPISMERFAHIAEERFPGCERKRVLFQWFNAKRMKDAVDQNTVTGLLAESYAWFRGDKG